MRPGPSQNWLARAMPACKFLSRKPAVAVPAKRAPNKSATFALALRIACANSRVFVGRPAVRTVPAGIFEAVVLRSVLPPTMFDGVAIAAKVSES